MSNNSTITQITAYQVFEDTNETKFKALQYSLFTTSFVEVIGGLFFLITAAYILRDKAKAEKAVSGEFSPDGYLIEFYFNFMLLPTVTCFILL